MAGEEPAIARRREQKIRVLRRKEEEERTEELAKSLGLPYRDLVDTPVEPAALLMVPEDEARAAKAAVIKKEGKKITVAAHDPKSPVLQKLVADLTHTKGLEPEILVVSSFGLEYVFAHYARYAGIARQLTGEVNVSFERIAELHEAIAHIENLKEVFAKIPPANAASLVEVLLGGALKLEASDIHIEPEMEKARIRYRLDGVLYEIGVLSLRAYELLTSRIKLLSGLKLNIEEASQDGRFTIKEPGGAEVEIRTSTLPGEHGEYIVMRVLNPLSLLSLPDLGLREDLIGTLAEEFKKPNGMILTSGPTGSGKTTTLYAFLKQLASPAIKIITIEDPIEYRIADIDQTQVNPEAGYDFVNGLRSIVRQDPDVILVGEVRDQETAAIALNASLTGQLVFSTIHANDAVSVVPRLLDLGIQPAILAPGLNMSMAQRLLRRVCTKCGEPYRADPAEEKKIRAALALIPTILTAHYVSTKEILLLKAGAGCADCHFTGYRGRIGIFELFRISKNIEELIAADASMPELATAALENGMIPVQNDGLLRVLERATTLEELERVTGPLGEAQ